MPKMIEKANPEEAELLARAMVEWHRDLVREHVKVAVVLIHPALDAGGAPATAAIKHAGTEVAAKIEIAPPKWRVLTGFDAVISIDAYRWELLCEQSQLALLDHELEHLVILRDKDGRAIHHDDGRPKVETRPDDWVLTGFESVIKRHGHHALEALALRKLHQDHQGVFEFMEPQLAATV